MDEAKSGLFAPSAPLGHLRPVGRLSAACFPSLSELLHIVAQRRGRRQRVAKLPGFSLSPQIRYENATFGAIGARFVVATSSTPTFSTGWYVLRSSSGKFQRPPIRG